MRPIDEPRTRSKTRGGALALTALATALPALAAQPARAAPVVLRADPRIPASALATVDALLADAWATGQQLFGAPADRPPPRFELVLYRDAAAYAAAEVALTGGRFRRNLAFTHWDTHSAHVAVQPDLSDDQLAAFGCGLQTLRLVVHETAHLLRQHAFANCRLHPGWLADGAASWLEVEVLAAHRLLSTPAADPTFATAMQRVQRLHARGELPTLAQILDGAAEDLDFYSRYAVHWCAFQFLATGARRDALARALADLQQFGSDAVPQRLRAALGAYLGHAGVHDADADFAAFVAALRPEWEQTARCLETAGEDWTQTAFAATDAIAWRTAPLGPGPHRITGAVTIARAGDGEVRLLLDRRNRGHLAVVLRAAHGVRVLAVDGGGSRELGAAAVALPFGEPIAFRITLAADGGLHVEVSGQTLAVATGQPRDSAWGLATTNGSTGIWHGLAAH